MTAPMPFEWDGEAMRPLPRFVAEANRRFCVGERYSLDVVEERSLRTHNHEFAAVAEAWLNLPEHLAAFLPNPEALRKYALIKAGYCDTETFVASTKAEAARIAAFVRSDMRQEFVLVATDGNIVTRYTAKSQSKRAMGRKTFQESKEAILGVISEMIGVSPDALSSHARGIAA